MADLTIVPNPKDKDLTVEDVLKTYNEKQKKYLYKCVDLAVIKGRVLDTYLTETNPILNTLSIKQRIVFDYLIFESLKEYEKWK